MSMIEPNPGREPLRKLLADARKILEGMKRSKKGQPHEFETADLIKALELRQTIERMVAEIPHVRGWFVICHYRQPMILKERIESGHLTEAAARKARDAAEANERKEYADHPWWGPYETHADTYSVREMSAHVSDFRGKDCPQLRYGEIQPPEEIE